MIRNVEPENDAEALAAIYNEYVLGTTISFETEAISPAQMARRIAGFASQYPYLVYEEAGQVLGHCYAHRWKERAAYARTWESTIYLAPQACGKGVGQALMQELISRCRAAGCRVLIACITQGNERSCRFHESLGFRRVSHFHAVGEKFGKLLDVVDYQLNLTGATTDCGAAGARASRPQ